MKQLHIGITEVIIFTFAINKKNKAGLMEIVSLIKYYLLVA